MTTSFRFLKGSVELNFTTLSYFLLFIFRSWMQLSPWACLPDRQACRRVRSRMFLSWWACRTMPKASY